MAENNGIYLNNVSPKLIHEREGKKGPYVSVGVFIDGELGNITVSPKSVHDRDGRKNIWLSNDPNYEMNVYFSKTKTSQRMTVGKIAEAYNANREAFKSNRGKDSNEKPLWIDGVSPKLIWEHEGKNGPFYSVGFEYEGKHASFTASPKQIYDSNDGKTKDVLVGSADTVKHVSVKEDDGQYKNIDLTAKQIVESVKESREKYAEEHSKEDSRDDDLMR